MFTLLAASPVVEKKTTLFKVVIFLVLRVRAETDVYKRIIQVAEQADSSEIVEDAVWLISALLQLAEAGDSTVLAQIRSLSVVPVVLKSLSSPKEALVLQSIKTLTSLAS